MKLVVLTTLATAAICRALYNPLAEYRGDRAISLTISSPSGGSATPQIRKRALKGGKPTQWRRPDKPADVVDLWDYRAKKYVAQLREVNGDAASVQGEVWDTRRQVAERLKETDLTNNERGYWEDTLRKLTEVSEMKMESHAVTLMDIRAKLNALVKNAPPGKGKYSMPEKKPTVARTGEPKNSVVRINEETHKLPSGTQLKASDEQDKLHETKEVNFKSTEGKVTTGKWVTFKLGTRV